jgi:hypothetical protein
MAGKKVRIKITETFTKEVEVSVPRMLNTDALIERWVRERLDARILNATDMFGVKEAGDMDYKREISICQ